MISVRATKHIAKKISSTN